MALTTVFLVVLALAWAGVFLPAVWRASQRTPLKSSEGFARRMSMIAPPRHQRGGRRLIVPRSAGRKVQTYRRSQRQRVRILAFLGALLPLSAIIAVVMGEGWWELHIAFDFSFALYVALLLEAKRRRQERLRKVRPLASRRRGERSAGRRETAAR